MCCLLDVTRTEAKVRSGRQFGFSKNLKLLSCAFLASSHYGNGKILWGIGMMGIWLREHRKGTFKNVTPSRQRGGSSKIGTNGGWQRVTAPHRCANGAARLIKKGSLCCIASPPRCGGKQQQQKLWLGAMVLHLSPLRYCWAGTAKSVRNVCLLSRQKGFSFHLWGHSSSQEAESCMKPPLSPAQLPQN